MPKIRDIMAVLEQFAPLNLQMDGDNCGLLYGSSEADLAEVLVTLDVTPDVVSEAIALGCNLIITHHPTIFKPIYGINMELSTHKALVLAIKNDIAIYACHTNCDFTIGGLNDCLAKKLDARDIKPLIAGDLASGRIATLSKTYSLNEYSQFVAEALNDTHIATVGDPNSRIRTIALINGAGGGSESVLLSAKNANADIFISSEFKYNVLRLAKDINYAIINLGHYDSEIAFIDLIADLLKNNGFSKNVHKATKCANPYN